MVEYDYKLTRPLTKAEIDYILCHIKMMVETSIDWDTVLIYGDKLPEFSSGKVFIPCSSKGWTGDLSIADIPVLYPCSDIKEPYFEKGTNIVFNHDFIKSAFYLLSGYQEMNPDVPRDSLGRFQYKGSIQDQLDMVFIPVVNYYMEWIIKGLEKWCAVNKVLFKRVSVFKSPIVHLSHNVRKVNYFNHKYIIDAWLQVLGIRPLDMPRKVKFKAAAYATKHALKLDIIDNPWWTFENLMNLEQQFGYYSTWFFLTDKSDPEDRGDVSLKSEDIRQMMIKMGTRGFDVGVLLPKKYNTVEQIMKAVSDMQDSYAESLPYCRINLHKLNTEEYLSSLDAANIMVDCSLHFPDNNGFRNSYCLPFYPFNHGEQKIMGLLEIPLSINASHFLKNKMSEDEIFGRAEQILDEIRKFNGMCSMQWSNSDFDSYKFPNSYRIYEDILRFASQYQTNSATTTDVVRRMISISNKLFE